MARMLFIAAGPRLLASLSEQFEALGGYALHRLDPETLDSAREADRNAAVIVDAEFCDAVLVEARLRMMGFAGTLIVIGGAMEEARASLPRPFRFTDLLGFLASTAESPGAGPQSDTRLTEKEAAILARLIRADGATLSRAELLADVWGYGPSVSTRTLETHIHRLRRKIESDPERPVRLLTEEGGYRLTKSAG